MSRDFRATSSQLFIWFKDPAAVHTDPTTLVGTLGGITALALFVCPTPTFYYRVWRNRGNRRNRGVGEYSASVIPYLAAVINCGLWVLYGLPMVHPHRKPIMIVNAIGLGIQIAYVALYFIIADSRQQRLRLVVVVAAEFIFVAALAILVLHLAHDTKLRSTIVGSFCIAGSVAYYASPLALMMKLVIRTRRVEHIPFEVAYFSFLNGFIWTTYAINPLDVFVLVPNAIGCVLGLVQMALHVSFYIREEVVQKALRAALYIRGLSRGIIDLAPEV